MHCTPWLEMLRQNTHLLKAAIPDCSHWDSEPRQIGAIRDYLGLLLGTIGAFVGCPGSLEHWKCGPLVLHTEIVRQAGTVLMQEPRLYPKHKVCSGISHQHVCLGPSSSTAGMYGVCIDALPGYICGALITSLIARLPPPQYGDAME